MRFSMIIPAYNEQDYLPDLLESVEKARCNYLGGTDLIEVIVADNGSTDRTAEIALERGCRLVSVDKRVIAASRNAGAAAAKGDILTFIDADSLIHPETFNVIERAMSSGKYVAGASGVRMERMSVGIALTIMCFLPVVYITGMDTGVVFCRNQSFAAVGGYDERKLFAEDADFLWRLRRLGLQSKQKLFRATAAKAITSTRKFDQFGDWHYFPLMCRSLYALCFSAKRAEQVAKAYWYQDDRPSV